MADTRWKTRRDRSFRTGRGRSSRFRRPRFESLEPRTLLSAGAGAAEAEYGEGTGTWHNPWNWYDVSGEGDVTPRDALILVNRINAHPDDSALPPLPAAPPYYDVDDDGRCTTSDVMIVVNALNDGVYGPAIKITGVPPYGVDGFLGGTVAGGDASVYRVAPYIYIDGAGWWTKPTADSPTVAFGADGNFTADAATGGLDNRATIYCAALIAADGEPPLALGSGRIPAELDAVAIDCVQRYGRVIEFADYTWGVKESPGPVGPGGNVFSDAAADVFVDEQGLHLTINPRDGSWWATEVVLLDQLGYGTYAFQTDSRLDELDANVTFGAYTWDAFGDDESGGSPFREIDFEDGRWGQAEDPTNAQMVVQPYTHPGNLERYTLPDLSGDAGLTRWFHWQPQQIEFVAVRGEHSPAADFASDLIHRFVYPHRPETGHFVPTEGRESFRFNLWPIDAAAPAGGEPVEVLITDFAFTEMPSGRD